MEKLMCLMDESLQVNGVDDAYTELWDEVVAMRIKVGDYKQRLQVKNCYISVVWTHHHAVSL
jgi:hypothetical protein